MAQPTTIPCENLNELGVRRRRTLGLLGAGGVLALAVGLSGVRAPATAYLLLALPAWAMALGLLQARERTCVRLAALGVRETREGGAVRVEGEELTAVRARARRISLTAVALAIAMGVIAMVLAGFVKGTLLR